MLSMLIVDDEMIIAEGLYQTLQDAFADQLLVRRCYSLSQAMHILQENHIDILMTDIEMPDGSGLELHRQVLSRWPMIRVIYLTGYSDFDYARRALDQKAMAYVLKSEGDPVLIETVQRAIHSIREEGASLLRMDRDVHTSSGHIHQLIYHAMHGGKVTPAQFQAALDEADVRLSANAPVLLGYCYCEQPGFNLGQAMCLTERLTSGRLSLLVTEMTPRAFLLLYQVENDRQRQMLHGLLENAQTILEKQSGLLTVCLLDQPVAWDKLMDAGEALLEQVNHTTPSRGELLHISLDTTSPVVPAATLGEEWSEMLESQRRLNEYLLTGQPDLYFEEEKHLWALVEALPDSRQAQAISSALTLSLLQCAGSLPHSERLRSEVKRAQASFEQMDISHMTGELHRLAEMLFDIRGQSSNNRQRQLVSRVNEFIATHMDGDLSLVAIADAVHFHPVYLSRIYKEHAGISLSDYIAKERLSTACQMLRTSQVQISAIAKSTGFTSSNYFSRWFRKHIGLTPQEYRDKALGTK